MALVKCKECGKEISDKAEVCPFCGCKTSQGETVTKAKIMLWLYGIGIAAFLIGVLFLLPALFKISANLNDWYFWNWGSEGDDAIRNVLLGGVIASIGVGVCVFAQRFSQALEKSKEEVSQKENDDGEDKTL